MDEFEDLVNKELELVKKTPHKYICEWMESILLHAGAKVFNYACLLPCSQILPNIPFQGSSIRAQQNIIIIAAPSSGKSVICRKISPLVINPIIFRKMSAPELRTRMLASEMFAIINEDFTQISDEYEVIKDLEGALGDEQQISAHNMRTSQEGRTKGVGLFCGTPVDLLRYMRNLEGGFFSRLNPIYLHHSQAQHSEIGKFINNGIGDPRKSLNMSVKEEAVRRFYLELHKIQNNSNPDIPAIAYYDLPENMKNKAYEKWNFLTKDLRKELDTYWIRELHEFYRFLISVTFLNVFNRKFEVVTEKDTEKNDVKFSILKPIEEDFDKALKLMEDNIKTKFCLIKSTTQNGRIRDVETLRSIMASNIDPMIKNILMNINPHAGKMAGTKTPLPK